MLKLSWLSLQRIEMSTSIGKWILSWLSLQRIEMSSPIGEVDIELAELATD